MARRVCVGVGRVLRARTCVCNPFIVLLILLLLLLLHRRFVDLTSIRHSDCCSCPHHCSSQLQHRLQQTQQHPTADTAAAAADPRGIVVAVV